MKRLTASLCLIVAFFMFVTSVAAEQLFEKDIKYQKTFTSGGKKYTMYWVCFSVYVDEKKELDAINGVNEIFIVPDAEIITSRKGARIVSIKNGFNVTVNGKKMWIMSYDVPKLTKIILHEPKGQEAFVGALVTAPFQDGSGVWNERAGTWEIRLPDDIANEMMDLVKERTKFRVPEGNALDRIFWGANMGHSTSTSLQSYKIM